jgi:hypothetical protein
MRISTTLATRDGGFTDEALEDAAADLIAKGTTTLTDPHGNKFPATVISAKNNEGRLEVVFEFDPTKGLEADIKDGKIRRMDPDTKTFEGR